MTSPIANQSPSRDILPDLVRAFAVFGIVVVNVAYFAWPGEVTYHDGGLAGPADYAAYFTVDALFLFKSYTLFSVMFGAGLAYQMASATRRGVVFGAEYGRRLLGLFILGVLHVTLAFTGDILMVYAVFGALLFLFRNKSVKALKRWAIAFICLQVIFVGFLAASLLAFESFAPQEFETINAEISKGLPRYYDGFDSGNFVEIAGLRWDSWTGYIIFAGMTQFPGVLGFFLAGLAAVKSGVLSDPGAVIWTKSRRLYLPVGLVLSCVGAWISVNSDGFGGMTLLGMAIIILSAPFTSLGYIGALAAWAERPATAFRNAVARAGSATLSIYLMQSLILSFVFSGYGLGLYGQIGAAGCLLIAVAVGIFTIAAMSMWRTKFARGPFESALRALTYMGRKS